MAKQILEYQIIDHGVEHSQYFQGCGTSFTDYDDCATGIGYSYKEALDDALEQLATDGYEIPAELEAESTSASDADVVSEILRDHIGPTKYITE